MADEKRNIMTEEGLRKLQEQLDFQLEQMQKMLSAVTSALGGK